MNKIVTLILVPGLVSILWAMSNNPEPVSPEQRKAIEQEILKVHVEMVKAAENSDPEGLFSHVLDECKGVIVQDGIIMMTRQESLDATAAHIMSGGVLADTSDETARNVARLTGRIEGLTFILELEGDEDE